MWLTTLSMNGWEMKKVIFTYLPTHSMPADILTKSLAGPKQALFCEKMGLLQKNWTGLLCKIEGECWSTILTGYVMHRSQSWLVSDSSMHTSLFPQLFQTHWGETWYHTISLLYIYLLCIRLRLYRSQYSELADISQQFHMSVMGCNNVTVSDIFLFNSFLLILCTQGKLTVV